MWIYECCLAVQVSELCLEMKVGGHVPWVGLRIARVPGFEDLLDCPAKVLTVCPDFLCLHSFWDWKLLDLWQLPQLPDTGHLSGSPWLHQSGCEASLETCVQYKQCLRSFYIPSQSWIWHSYVWTFLEESALYRSASDIWTAWAIQGARIYSLICAVAFIASVSIHHTLLKLQGKKQLSAIHSAACIPLHVKVCLPRPKHIAHWGRSHLRFSVPISTLAMNPKVVLRKEYKGCLGGWSTEMMSMGLTLPLQSACAAKTGVHIPVLADRPFPVPVGIRQRGTLIASFQSSRLNKPCSRALNQSYTKPQNAAL